MAAVVSYMARRSADFKFETPDNHSSMSLYATAQERHACVTVPYFTCVSNFRKASSLVLHVSNGSLELVWHLPVCSWTTVLKHVLSTSSAADASHSGTVVPNHQTESTQNAVTQCCAA